MWLVTRMPVAKPFIVNALAKVSGLPGMRYSGCLTYGRIFSSGCFTHEESPASAIEAPIRCRNRLRLTGVLPHRGPGGELVLHRGPELLGVGQLVEAAPVLLAGPPRKFFPDLVDGQFTAHDACA